MHKLANQDSTIWVYPQIDAAWAQEIIKEFNIHPVTAQVLASRGFTSLDDIHDYLYAKLPNLLDPNLFPEMERAVERVMKALKNKETVLIYGDNDVDGITGATLLTEFLRFIGINTLYYISNRSLLNKSLLLDALEFAVKNSCSLIITVDCGITAAQEIAETVKHGVDVIVTDHLSLIHI